MDSKFVKYAKEDIEGIKTMYESVMTFASHGLFFRTGKIVGRRIAEHALKEREYFDKVADALRSEGWVDHISFDNSEIRTRGSIETHHGEECTCHMLRGIIASVYEMKGAEKPYCREVDCESKGAKECVFLIDHEVV
ncbi:MAG: V4R domain-containing protein [Candidatus Thermoplasmatota archaeon]